MAYPGLMTAALPPLDDALLARRLLRDAGGSYARIERLESVGSTNQRLLDALAEESETRATTTAWPHLSVLTAEEQTGGRGRLGRSWSSPRGASLSTSIVLRPQLEPVHWGWLSMLAGRALVDTLRQDVGLDAEDQRAVLKWPNDVQVTQAEGPAKKISGILAAAAPAAPAAPQGSRTGPGAVVLGVGINVLLTADQLPIEAATSVLIELDRRRSGGRVVSAVGSTVGAAVEAGSDAGGEAGEMSRHEAQQLRTDLLCCFLERFADLLGAVEEAARQAPATVSDVLIGMVAEVLTTLGQQVRVELPDGTAERGVARGLTSYGGLQVEVTARRAAPEQDWAPVTPVLRPFSAGDVTHLRPAP